MVVIHRVFQGLNEGMYTKCLEECLMLSNSLINVNYSSPSPPTFILPHCYYCTSVT